MAFNCPSCSAAIPDAVSKETMTGRLDAKNSEIALLKTNLGELTTQVQGHATVAEELAGLKADNAQLQQASALTGAGIDAKKHDGFRVLYDSAIAGAEAPPTFADWLADSEGGAPAHPLLAAHFTAAAATTTDAAAATTTTQQTTTALPNGDAGVTVTPPNQGKMNPQQLAAYFQTPEFKNLPNADKRAKIAEMETQHG